MTKYELDSPKANYINSEFSTVLSNAGVNSVRALVTLGPMEISRATSLSLDEATSVYNWAYSKLASSTTLILVLSRLIGS
jgi:hypothetical protein